MRKQKLLVVLYNKGLYESESCLSLLKLNSRNKQVIERLYIWNNSQTFLPASNKISFTSEWGMENITYFEDGINHPLSIVYNTIISQINHEGILILFDHDSEFADDYFYCLLKAAEENHEINLFLPLIYYSKILVSPARHFYFYGRYFKNLKSGIISSHFLTAINSGMAIRCSYLKQIFQSMMKE